MEATEKAVACWLYRNMEGTLLSTFLGNKALAKAASRGLATRFCLQFDGEIVTAEVSQRGES